MLSSHPLITFPTSADKMESALGSAKANSSPLKRSFTGIAKASIRPFSHASPPSTLASDPQRPSHIEADQGPYLGSQPLPIHRGNLRRKSAASSSVFMSIVEEEEDTRMTEAIDEGTIRPAPMVKGPQPAGEAGAVTGYGDQYPAQHQHRDSTSTVASESTDSSPTTTISTVDSSSLTEPSPSSSPESPVTIVPLSSFKSKSFSVQSTDELPMSPPLSPFSGYHGPISPGKRARNTKNLSLNVKAPSRISQNRSLQVKTVLSTDSSLPQSAPPSPSFIVPPKPQRKRPSNLGLTIRTPSCGGAPEGGLSNSKLVPPTPSGLRPGMLRHHQSSPALSIFAPPKWGHQRSTEVSPCEQTTTEAFRRLGHPAPNFGHRLSVDSTGSIPEHSSPVVPEKVDELEEEEEHMDVPSSAEQKSPAYPSGPVCIYEPHVYLYLEPTRDEALEFDVILNVAREVLNPFKRAEPTPESYTTSGDDTSEPKTATSAKSFETAFESMPSDIVSPTTPKAASAPANEPEYIHIPWDHQTNIVDDLLNIVEIIDERVRQGKRILVHCQCGVSRSASLIVAYGLYKNPTLSMQEAYDAVKKRSRWIGPNMGLIYQLSEFRTKLIQKVGNLPPPGGFRTRRGSPSSMLGLGSSGRSNTIPNGSPTSSTRPFLSLDILGRPSPEPQSAPLPDDRDRTPVRSTPISPPAARPATAGGDVTPGPSSAPSGIVWPSVPSVRPPPPAGESGVSDGKIGLLPPPLPQSNTNTKPPLGQREAVASARGVAPTPSSAPSIRPQPSREFGVGHGNVGLIAPPFPLSSATTYQSFNQRQVAAGTGGDMAPPTPSLWSPRAIEFTANPFEQPQRSMAPPPPPAAASTQPTTTTPPPSRSFGNFDSFTFSAPDPAPADPSVPTSTMAGGENTRPPAAATMDVDMDVDPRSPAHRGEAPIVRSIFDAL